MEKEMYYNRKLSENFSQLIEPSGKLRWLFDFVKNQNDLDFLIGKNKTKEWVSVYRGLSRLITITKTNSLDIIKIDGADAYKDIMPDLYGNFSTNKNFESLLFDLLENVRTNKKFDRYYNNRKEGYFQNELSRKYGINGNSDSEFVIIDKEAVIGYDKQESKNELFGTLRGKYKDIQRIISQKDAVRYGKDLENKFIGNELDFIAVDRTGNILLIEYKNGTNTSGIYLSPLQIGLYYDIFTIFDREDFKKALISQLKQKQAIGLINPNWEIPKGLKNIVPVLIISEYNYKSFAKEKYHQIMSICRKKLGQDFLNNIKTFNYTSLEGLKDW